MILAYINYPNPHIKLHSSGCGHVRQHGKTDQRIVKLNVDTVSAELERFRDQYYTFGATAATNDMWLEIDFADLDFEKALAAHIRRLLSEHYSPFRDVTPEIHDCLR